MSLLALLLAGCSFTSARDVFIHGRVVDADGRPVAGTKVYIADLKYELTVSGMPGVGEHAFVFSDADGQYGVIFKKLHSAVSISIMDYVKRHGACPVHLEIDAYAPIVGKQMFAGMHEVYKDLVYCVGP